MKTVHLGIPLVLVHLLGGCSDCTREVTDPCHESVAVTVSRVVDGDTLDVEPAVELADGSAVERIRLLCVDTPETGECYHDEATDFLRSRVEGREVTLDFSRDCSGDYGRVLAYVHVGTSLINVEVAEEGFGMLIHPPYDDYPCCDEVEMAARRAFEDGVGGWDACSGSPWQL